jgi:predicted DNA-binding mobile mystery protein A
MSVKKIVLAQYRDIVDRARLSADGIPMPKEGWINTVRKALNISVTQLAARLNMTRANVYYIEKAEKSGAATLKKMEETAKAMECRFVYAIVPNKSYKTVEGIVHAQAILKALEIVKRTNAHMALESQTLSMDQIEFEIERVAKDILRDKPSDIWNKK